MRKIIQILLIAWITLHAMEQDQDVQKTAQEMQQPAIPPVAKVEIISNDGYKYNVERAILSASNYLNNLFQQGQTTAKVKVDNTILRHAIKLLSIWHTLTIMYPQGVSDIDFKRNLFDYELHDKKILEQIYENFKLIRPLKIRLLRFLKHIENPEIIHFIDNKGNRWKLSWDTIHAHNQLPYFTLVDDIVEDTESSVVDFR